ncbi:MAG: lamin tail domain-containing protein [Lutimonas sp.]
MKLTFTYLFCFVFSISVHSQNLIAKQGFETSGDTWNPLNFSTQPCTNNGDTWNFQTNWRDLGPTEGDQFWAIEDLNGDCGGSDFESIFLPEINISSFRNVQLSFDYFYAGYNSTDRIKYQVIINQERQEEVMLFTQGLNENTENWKTELINIPNYAKTLELIISIKQNGQGDFAGFDNIKLAGTEITPCGQLIISELAEGTSSSSHRNNYIEIYNPSDSPIDLNNYDLVSYRNKNEQHISPLKLEGIIPAYDVFIIEDETEILNVSAQLSTNSAVLDFTGDDKIALRQNEEIIDLIGKIGDSVSFYENKTFRRKREIDYPTSNFNPDEWDVLSLEDVSDLHQHSSYCKEPSPQISVLGNGIEIIDNHSMTYYENNTFFGTFHVSHTAISKDFTIENKGISTLEISSFSLIEHQDLFDIEALNSVSIPPGGSVDFTLSFLPNKTGSYQTEIIIQNNDPAKAEFNLTIYVEVGGETDGPLLISQYYQGTGFNKWIEVTNTSNQEVTEGQFYLCTYRNETAFNPHNQKPSATRAIPTLKPGESILFCDAQAIIPSYALDLPRISSTTASITGNDMLIISSTNDDLSWQNRIDVIGKAGQWTEPASYVRKYGCHEAKPYSVFHVDDWSTPSLNEINEAENGFSKRLGAHYTGPAVFYDDLWTNGKPELMRPAEIKSDFNTEIHGEFEACSLIVDGNIQLEIAAKNSINIENDINAYGKINILHEGALIQLNDQGLVNGNNFEIHKTVNNLKLNDYIYWSSPVVAAKIREVFAHSNQNSFFWFNTAEFKDNDKDTYEDNQHQAWQLADELMVPGRGYTALAENSGPFKSVQDFMFEGKVNNGKIFVPIHTSSKDTVSNNNWNFIGNPYPSAIDIHQLLSNENNEDLLNGAVYFWTHHASPVNGKYSSSNYAAYTLGTGGIKAAEDGLEPTNFLASCQGVFVNAKKAGNLEFNNGMRTKDPGNIFFKNESKDRLWLSVKNDEGVYNQILIGFMEGATPEFDAKFDALLPPGQDLIQFYSWNHENKYAIQGIGTFDEDQIIDIGLKVTIPEKINLTIRLDKTEGELSDRKIWLYDKYLGLIHDLTDTYDFSLSEKGIYEDRFQLYFKEPKMTISNSDKLSSELIVRTNLNEFLFETKGEKRIIKGQVFDLLGRTVMKRELNHQQWSLNKSDLKDHFYIVQLQFDDYTVYNKKLIVDK